MFGSKKKEDYAEIDRQKNALQAQINELQSFIKDAPEKLHREEQDRLQHERMHPARSFIKDASNQTIPSMPCVEGVQQHRERLSVMDPPYPALVSRKVNRAEFEKNPVAKLAMDTEWQKLVNAPWPDKKGTGVWGQTQVRSVRAVRAEATQKGFTRRF